LGKTSPFFLAVLFLTLLSFSAEATPIHAIRMPASTEAKCSDRPITRYEEAASAIVCESAKELNLPIHATYLLLHQNRQAFESSLVNGRKFDAAYARETASWAVALSTADLILANEAALRLLPWPERVRVIAHELVHTVQYDLVYGRRSNSDQWLREGLAEWVAYRVVNSLKLGNFSQRITLASSRVRKAYVQGPLPRLSQMVTFRDFAELRSRPGAPPLYDQTLLAADFLIQQNGLEAVLQYFRLFGHSDDRLENFRASFGKDLSTFEEEFGLHLQEIFH
jgi:hypothetical protein